MTFQNSEYQRIWHQKNKKKYERYQKEYQKKYYQKHKERIKKHQNEYWKKKLIENPEKAREYRKSNIERIRENERKWACNNKDKYRKTQRETSQRRRKIDPKFRIDCNMGSLIWHTLRGKKAGKKWEDLIGYTTEDLMEHLERQFDENMNWDNYGTYWDVDHIKPKSLFKYSSPNDLGFKKCWALKNLQPLEHIANIKKSNKGRIKNQLFK